MRINKSIKTLALAIVLTGTLAITSADASANGGHIDPATGTDVAIDNKNVNTNNNVNNNNIAINNVNNNSQNLKVELEIEDKAAQKADAKKRAAKNAAKKQKKVPATGADPATILGISAAACVAVVGTRKAWGKFALSR